MIIDIVTKRLWTSILNAVFVNLEIWVFDIVLHDGSLDQLGRRPEDWRQRMNDAFILRVDDVEPQKGKHPNESRRGGWTAAADAISGRNFGFGQTNEHRLAAKLVLGEFQQLDQTGWDRKRWGVDWT